MMATKEGSGEADGDGFPDGFARITSLSTSLDKAIVLLREINMTCICHLCYEKCWTCRRNEFLSSATPPAGDPR